MRKPDENLDDYNVKPATVTEIELPRAVSLGRTGEVEVLKPLMGQEVPPPTMVFRRRSIGQPLWFRRLIAVGSGALAMIGLVLVSAILMGIDDPAAELDIATQMQPEEKVIQAEEPFNFEILSPSSVATLRGGIDIVRASVKRKVIKPRVQLAQQPRPYIAPLQAEEPKFVPTTLVIYSDNGVIKTRIEPWIQSS
jgi:hypothetical protein